MLTSLRLAPPSGLAQLFTQLDSIAEKIPITLRQSPVNHLTYVLRGGTEISHEFHLRGLDQKNVDVMKLLPPHKKSRLSADAEQASDCEQSTDGTPVESFHEDESSEYCPSCGRILPHVHSNNTAADTKANISIDGHSLEPFVDEFFASIHDLPTTVYAYNVLLQHCLVEKKLTTALAIYSRMKNESIAPSFETCDILLSLCESEQEWDLAVRVAQDLLATGLCADEKTYDWMIKICSKLRAWDVILDLYDEMIHVRMDPCSKTRIFAIQACQGQGLWRRALDEFDELRKQTSAASLPYSYVIEACTQAGQIHEAQKLIEEHEAQQRQVLEERHLLPGAESDDSRVVRLEDSRGDGDGAESGEEGEDGLASSGQDSADQASTQDVN